VVEEIRKGYKLRDKLLRPALVKIAVNSKQVNE
jgi:molecular chaperone GrpE